MNIERKTQPSYGMLWQPNIEDSTYVHMLLEDIGLHLISLHLSDSVEIKFASTSTEENVSDRAAFLLSEPSRFGIEMQDAQPRFTSEVVSDFIVAVCRDLVLRGNSYWELGRVNVSEPKELCTQKLFWIAGDVTERRNTILQRIVRIEDGSRKRYETILPSSQVQIFRLPKCLGTVREQRDRILVV